MKRDYKKDAAVILLKESFVKVFLKYTTIENVDKLWKQVLRIYTGKNRHYHNIDHIAHMVNLWELFYDKLTYPDEIFMAIIYHDIVYSSRGKDNEEKSADLFMAIWHSFDWEKFDNSKFNFVAEAIKATTHRDLKMSMHEDVKFLLDFDLHILSTPHQDEYEWYRLGVRKEYSHVSLKKYKEGRKAVLESFLKRKEIYLTQTFKINEKKARKNLKNEINLYLCENKNK